MKNSLKIVLLVAFAFGLGLGINNFAMSGVPANFKVAVVDVQKVVSSSKQVSDLKKEQTKKMDEIKAFIENAQSEIAKTPDLKKKEVLANRYDKQLSTKKTAQDKEYAKKLSDIDKNITNVIITKAKKKGYNLVLAKGVVLFGGDDLTEEIAKSVK